MPTRSQLRKLIASPARSLTESLADENFRIYRQTRTGLLSHPVDPDLAKGHLGASIYLQMAVKPHIVHVVGFPEAHHATTAEELIQSCKIARRAIENAINGAPDMTADPIVEARKRELIEEALVTLEAIKGLARKDAANPFTDPQTLARAVNTGILDAPHLKGHPLAKGQVVTRVIDGACKAVDPKTGEILPETERIRSLHTPTRERW